MQIKLDDIHSLKKSIEKRKVYEKSDETYVSLKGIRHGKRWADPAECVDHMRRHSVDNTWNRLTDILGGSYN